jgi:hypothetical protein
MRRKRLALTLAVLATLALVFAGVARAAFTRTATVSQSLSSLSVGAASALTGAASGHNVIVNWSAGSSATAYAVNGVANGTSSTCPASGYSNISNPTATTLTDARSTPQGIYECYQVVSTHGSWSSQSGNPTVAVQLGVVVSSVTIANGAGVAGTLDAGDVITLRFNQAINTSTGPASTDSICSKNGTDEIVLGSTGSGASCSDTQVDLGILDGGTVGKKGRWDATWTWSAGNTVLTVLVGALTSGQDASVTGAQTFNPDSTSTDLTSATGGFHTCSSNTGGGNCLPVATGSF